MTIQTRLGAAALILALACACMGDFQRRAVSAPADVALARSVLALEKPPADRARLLVFNGGRYNSSGYVPNVNAVRFKVNGIVIGEIDRSTAMVVDLAPGQYTLQWETLANMQPLAATIEPTSYTVAGGELLPLQTDTENWVFKVKKGFNPGQLVPGGQQRLNPDVEIMRPTTCPPGLCL